MIVEWSAKAKGSYESLLDYLLSEWSEKEAENLTLEVSKVLLMISIYPKIFKSFKNENIRLALITKHTSLYYKIYPEKIILVTFWDNRQNKLPKL